MDLHAKKHVGIYIAIFVMIGVAGFLFTSKHSKNKSVEKASPDVVHTKKAQATSQPPQPLRKPEKPAVSALSAADQREQLLQQLQHEYTHLWNGPYMTEREAFNDFLNDLSPENLGLYLELIERIREADEFVEAIMLDVFLARWEQFDRDGTIRYVMEKMPKDERGMFMPGVMYRWTQDDMEAALAFAKDSYELEAEHPKMEITATVITSLMEHDLDRAFALVTDLPEGKVNDKAVYRLFEALGDEDLELCWELVEQLPNERMKEHAKFALINDIATPKLAMENLLQLTMVDPVEINRSATHYGLIWGGENPSEAMNWAIERMEPEAFTKFGESALMTWKAKHPDEANEWLITNSTDPRLKLLVKNHAHELADFDKQNAWDWAQSLEDSEIKTIILNELTERYTDVVEVE